VVSAAGVSLAAVPPGPPVGVGPRLVAAAEPTGPGLPAARVAVGGREPGSSEQAAKAAALKRRRIRRIGVSINEEARRALCWPAVVLRLCPQHSAAAVPGTTAALCFRVLLPTPRRSRQRTHARGGASLTSSRWE